MALVKSPKNFKNKKKFLKKTEQKNNKKLYLLKFHNKLCLKKNKNWKVTKNKTILKKSLYIYFL